MSEPKLKPCPFCGGGCMSCVSANEDVWHFVICGGCCGQGPEVRGADNAIAAWNKRAGEGHTMSNRSPDRVNIRECISKVTKRVKELEDDS